MTCLNRMASKAFLGGVMASLLMVISSVTNASAEDPVGLWITERGLARVVIDKCAEALCGTITALKDPIDPTTGKPQTDTDNEDPAKRNRPVIGIRVIIEMKPDGANRWSGQLYNAEDGKTYSGYLIMDGANTLNVKGCIMMVLCKTQKWTRVK